MNKKYIFRKASKKDLPSIISLIELSGLLTEHILGNIENFIVAEYKDKIIGCGCILFYDKLVEIRSLSVEKNFQGQGIGSKILKNLLRVAKDKDIKSIYLRTFSHNKDHFLKFGFKELPQKMVLELFDQCKTCERYAGPRYAVLMEIKL